MKTRQTRGRKMPQPKQTGGAEEEKSDDAPAPEDPKRVETLVQWLEFHQSEVESTADILKDELRLIKRRKIESNLAILKDERRPETSRLAKSIVVGFHDSINKAIKNLQLLGVTMTNEIKERYNLPEDWIDTSSIITSIAGSEIVGPTCSRKEIENRNKVMAFLEGSRDSDTSDVSKNVKFEADSIRSEEKAQNAKTASDVSVLRVQKEGESSNTSSINVNVKTSACDIGDIGMQKEEVSCLQNQDTLDDIINNDLHNISAVTEDVDMIPPSDDESSVASDVTVPRISQAKSPLKHVNATSISTATENNVSGVDEDAKEIEPGADLPDKKPIIVNQKDGNVEEGSSDSDGSGKTRIVPRVRNQESKQKISGETCVKKEPGTDSIRNSHKIVGPSPRKSSKNPSPVKSEPISDDINKKSIGENCKINHDGREEEETNVTTAPPILKDSSIDLDIADHTTPNEDPRNSEDDLSQSLLNFQDITDIVEDTTIVEISSKNTEAMEIDNLECLEGETKDPTEIETRQQKKVEETGNRRAKFKIDKLDKEEADAMRDVLNDSSSSGTEEQGTSKKCRERKAKHRSPKKNAQSDAENGTNNHLDPTESWKDDPKLKEGAAEVRLDRLSSEIEKALDTQRYVVLTGYSKMKKCRPDILVNGEFTDSDSYASDDSLVALKNELKKLSKNSIVRTLKYRRRTGKGIKSKPHRKTGHNKSHDESISLSDATASESDPSNSTFKIGVKDNDSILSCSGSEDLEPDSQENKDQKATKKPEGSRKQVGNKKKYISANLSSSDSEKEDKKFVLGSDSDSDSNKKTTKKKRRGTSDSDSDFIAVRKTKGKTKKQKKGSDSDVSIVTLNSDSDSDSDSDFKDSNSKKRRRDSPEPNKKRKKKTRRRIVNNDSDEDGSGKKESGDSDIEVLSKDDEDESQKGRKKIRKIMSTKHLAKTTREAEKEEEERRKRLSEKQNLFNGIHKAVESDKLERLVLDVDPETKEPLIQVDESIVKHLKPHQAEGIKFMYNACFESVSMIKEDKVPGGCILAHCMGLGKTLQSVAFVHTLLTHEVCGIRTALIICPLSTVNNWYGEFRRWTEEADDIRIHKLYDAKNSIGSKIDYLKVWEKRGGVGIMHYDLFRRLVDPKRKAKISSKYRDTIENSLLKGPDIVICDEGHLLKNWKSMLSMSVNSLVTRRRIVLTGTPLQNNLVEYHTMMNFVKPNLLGSLPEFTNRFVNPIKNGQHADSTDYDVKIMKRRSHVLHRKLEGCVQRCDYSILAPYLPPKSEYIIHIKLSEKQEILYKYYLENVVDSDLTARKRQLLKYYAELVKVWSHPIALTMSRSNKADTSDSEESDSLKDFIVDGSSETSENESGEATSDAQNKKSRKTRSQAATDPDPLNMNGDVTEIEKFSSKWWSSIFKTKSEMYDVELSGKLVVLQQILRTCESIGDKVLVFSQFLSSLDIIEEFIREWDEEAAKQKGIGLTFPLTEEPALGRWRRDIEYFRIDGQTKVGDRHRNCETFNRKSAMSRAKLFLISTRAGGLGINLYGANRVVIFDASWNPSQDMQSIFRVYRFGQDKPCYIYRLIARGTMEEKILRRQITKLSLSSRVVDEHQIERHFKFDDVNEMYRYDVEDGSSKEPMAVPKDRLLADLLISHEDWIRNYEEFDSLLENKPDEGLSKEEKETAWEEYRLESERQRQFNTSVNNNSETNETYIKVRDRILARNPNALDSQIRDATKLSCQVIDRIRTLMLQQNQSPPELKPKFDAFVLPLKAWLQDALSPLPEGSVPPPRSASDILSPLPFQIQPPVNTRPPINIRPQMNIRPPIIRRQQIAPQPPLPNVVNNFQNIAAAAIQRPQQRHHVWNSILAQNRNQQANFPTYPQMGQPFPPDNIS